MKIEMLKKKRQRWKIEKQNVRHNKDVQPWDSAKGTIDLLVCGGIKNKQTFDKFPSLLCSEIVCLLIGLSLISKQVLDVAISFENLINFVISQIFGSSFVFHRDERYGWV